MILTLKGAPRFAGVQVQAQNPRIQQKHLSRIIWGPGFRVLGYRV